MGKTRYFFFIKSYHKGSPDYMKPASVHRMRDGTKPESWNPKSNEWEYNPRVIASSGIGGDNDYTETTEVDAMQFVASHTNKTEEA
jgi:hypothetical protein